MEHYYNTLQHWFDYPDIFLEAISNANGGEHFVEIGIWKGGSASFMGVEILNSGKKIKYDAIDCFAHTKEFGKLSEDIYTETKLNLKPLTDLGVVNLIKSHSLDIVHEYKENSLSLCFIDGSHEYEDVKADLVAWLPKVKVGGILAGHDYNNPYHVGVYHAANEILGKQNIIQKGSCYYFKK
jgi:predicted O-methyltransferase YrrM